MQKAKKKVIVEKKPSDFGIDLGKAELPKVEDPPQREGGTRVKDVDDLISKLKALGRI